jgi:major membrane immunogen (membrane-anchored lipoprotein)
MKKIWSLCIVLALAVPFLMAEFKDGAFTAKDTVDKRGYTGEIKLTVEKGTITKVAFEESKGGKNPKRTDKNYNSLMKKTTKVSWAEAVAKYEEALLKTQDPAKVDKVSGATDAHKRFVALAAIALSAK